VEVAAGDEWIAEAARDIAADTSRAEKRRRVIAIEFGSTRRRVSARGSRILKAGRFDHELAAV
jgi:hypothetical protein